jgi:hypothetical protein
MTCIAGKPSTMDPVFIMTENYKPVSFTKQLILL